MSDLTTTNRTHFNKVASTHHTDFGPLIETLIDEIKTRRLWISASLTDKHDHPVRLLDYACGAGTASKALLPFITQAVGLDLSENMVAEYNAWARGQGHPPETMQAYHLDLLADRPAAGIELSGFDVVVVCMALHHVADVGLLLGRLAGCLRPGGVCVVVDGVPSASTSADGDTADADTADLRAVLTGEQLGVLETVGKHG
ncbi:class I SAM-dependent methyltransferase, partial [Aspergillus thermomutatus]